MGWGGRWEAGDMGVPKADSCSCMTEKHKNFTSSPIWIPSISFSSLIVVCRTSRTILNNCGKSGHPFLIPDLGVLLVFHH